MAGVSTVLVSNLEPNPFRGIEHYTLNEERIAELSESIGETGFWANVYGRPKPGGPNGTVEIAYGHHRIEAARRLKLKAVPLVIEKMDDERMFAMMLRENSEAFGGTATVDAGAIAGLLAGTLDGRLELRSVKKDAPTHTIYLVRRDFAGALQIVGPGGQEVVKARNEVAPQGGHLFTASTLSARLCWTKSHGDGRDEQPTDRFRRAFKALTQLIIPGAIEPKELDGLTADEVSDVADATREASMDATKRADAAEAKAATETDPKTAAIAQKHAAELRREEHRVRREAAKAVAAAMRDRKKEEAAQKKKARLAAKATRPKKPKPLPPIERYVADLVKCAEAFVTYQQIWKRATRLVSCLGDMDDSQAKQLARSLRRMLERNGRKIEDLAIAFENKNERRIKALLAN